MSKEEIIKQIEDIIIRIKTNRAITIIKNDDTVIQNLLDLYNKENETSHYIQSQLDIADFKLVEIRKLIKEYKPNQSNTFIKEHEKYITLVEEIEKLLD